jgi:4-carboxymuconolactone decarboxylase
MVSEKEVSPDQQAEEAGSATHERGLSTMAILAKGGHGPVIEKTRRLSEDFKDMLVAAYGDLISRPQLSLKTRELVTVATLVSLGNARNSLKFHFGGMLNVGWTSDEILALVMHCLMNAGLSQVVDALECLAAATDEIQGLQFSARQDASENAARPVTAQLPSSVRRALSSDTDLTVNELAAQLAYSSFKANAILSIKDLELTDLSLAIARGNDTEGIREHALACLRAGWSRTEICEAAIHLTGYVGWPPVMVAIDPLLSALELFDEGRDPPDDESVWNAGEVVTPACQPCGDNGREVVESAKRAILDAYEAQAFSKTGLDPATSALVKIAALSATARASDEAAIALHARQARSAGVEWPQIEEALRQVMPYATFARTMRCSALAKAGYFGTANHRQDDQ